VLARLVELNQGFAMVPLTAALPDAIVELASLRTPDPYPGFERLSAGIEHVLRIQASQAGPLAYVETDYFGGVGEQRAIAWRSGEVLVGPFFSRTDRGDSGLHTEPSGERAVNRVLSALGVTTRGRTDPFEALALGQYRHTESLVTNGV
jgi:hypothetical protein